MEFSNAAVWFAVLEFRENEPRDFSASLWTGESCLDIDEEKQALNLSRCFSDHSTRHIENIIIPASTFKNPLLLYWTERRRRRSGAGLG